MSAVPRAVARIDLDRLALNFAAVLAHAGRPVMPVVKADAYGHGAVPVARRFLRAGAAMVAVAYVAEAKALRKGGIAAPIVVLTPFGPEEIDDVLAHGLTPIVSTPTTASGAIEAGRRAGRPLVVHVKVDTGMGRLGFAPSRFTDVCLQLAESGHVTIEGVMTHLACADEDPAFTEEQLDRFEDAIGRLDAKGMRPRWVHAANSAGLLHLRPSQTLVRPGLILYGVRPRPLSPSIDVQPVMTVAARIGLLKDVPVGTAVSYGARWRATRPSRIATVLLGYEDGVPRTDGMRERGRFLVRGAKAPVAGTVCMDLTMLDVTDHPEVRDGDEAVLLGDEPTAWDVAGCAGTNGWQALTAISERVPRVYLEGGRVVDATA